ncbi:MAG: hypothetical protein K6C97_00480 [Treponema sp.]|nr:hypothetical protein [Treponema sp.]
MKKLKSILILLNLSLILLAGCKSIPVGRVVDPIELLDNNSAFYIAIPKAADTLLIERMIKNNVKNLSEADAKLISDKVNKIYCGLNRSRNFLEVQASIDSDIPVKLAPKIMNKKNGWKITAYKPESSILEYPIYSYQDIDLSFPNPSITCLGRNIEEMLTKYDRLSSMPAEDTNLYSDLPEELLTYLKGAEEEIRFYANKPQSFLTILTGANLDLRLIDVKGSFVTDPKHENQYLLDLEFNFKNEKFRKAGRALLTLAFGLTNSQAEEIDLSVLKINGIRIDKKQLYKILVL